MAKDKLFAKAVLTIREKIQNEHWYIYDSIFGKLKLSTVLAAEAKDRKGARHYLEIGATNNLSDYLDHSKFNAEYYDQLLFVCGLILEKGDDLRNRCPVPTLQPGL